jgi:hypothetical protein
MPVGAQNGAWAASREMLSLSFSSTVSTREARADVGRASCFGPGSMSLRRALVVGWSILACACGGRAADTSSSDGSSGDDGGPVGGDDGGTTGADARKPGGDATTPNDATTDATTDALPADSAPAADGGSQDAPVGNDSGRMGTWGCPATLPTAGAPCTLPDGASVTCEYGGDANGLCTTTVYCGRTAWVVTPPAAGCGQNNAACPSSYGTGEGLACPVNSTCEYAAGRCGCLPCVKDGAPGMYWHCRMWTDVGSGCPVPRQPLGSACGVEGTMCDYNQCCGGPSLGASEACNEGIWQSAFGGGCACAMRACP